MPGKEDKPAETWSSKLVQSLIEHGLKWLLVGLLGIAAAFLGARYNVWICKLVQWFGDGWC